MLSKGRTAIDGLADEAKASLDVLCASYHNFSIRKFREAMVFSPRALDRMAEQMRALGIPEE